MKKTFTILLLAAVGLSIKAQIYNPDFSMGNLHYRITVPNEEVELIPDPNSCTFYAGDIIIPDSVQHNGIWYKVTSIGYQTFRYATLNSLTLPKGIRSIGEGCFKNASFVRPLSMPDSLRIIGNSAFYGVVGIGKLYIPALVDSIGNRAFTIGDLRTFNVDTANRYYSSLDGVLYNKDKTKLLRVPIAKDGGVFTIPEGVSTIGHTAFEYCSFYKIIIPNTVVQINSGAFWSCSSLGDLHIPAATTSIKGGVFSGCRSLYRLSIDSLNPNYKLVDNIIYSINMDTLVSHYLSKDSVIVPEGVRVIDSYAFSSTNLETVVLPEGLDKISGGAFYNSLVRRVSLPRTLKSIGNEAFSECRLLRDVVIYDSVYEIGSRAFLGCAFTEMVIPNSVKKIGEYAFVSCLNLRSIVMSDSVRVLPKEIFYNCASLKSYTGGNSVERIEESAFLATNIKGMVFPETLRVIEDNAFYYTPINSLKFTGVIDTIGRENFGDLYVLRLGNPTPPFTYNKKIANSIRKTYIPCGATEAYKSDPNWSSYSYTEDCDGVEENPMAAVKVTTGYRSIEVLNAEGYHVAIYDVMGRCIVSEPANGGTHRHYAVPTAGIYVVRVNNKGYKVVVR